MTSIILNLIKGFVTKELLLAIFRDIVLETVIDIVSDYAKTTTNPYDDQLVANLKAFIEKTK